MSIENLFFRRKGIINRVVLLCLLFFSVTLLGQTTSNGELCNDVTVQSFNITTATTQEVTLSKDKYVKKIVIDFNQFDNGAKILLNGVNIVSGIGYKNFPSSGYLETDEYNNGDHFLTFLQSEVGTDSYEKGKYWYVGKPSWDASTSDEPRLRIIIDENGEVELWGTKMPASNKLDKVYLVKGAFNTQQIKDALKSKKPVTVSIQVRDGKIYDRANGNIFASYQCDTNDSNDDFDNDGIPDITDPDDDNDGIPDTVECPTDVHDFSEKQAEGWTVEGTGTPQYDGAGGKGLTFFYDGNKYATLSKKISRVVGSETFITLTGVAWINTVIANSKAYSTDQEFVFTVSYAGVPYLTIGATGDNNTRKFNLKVSAQGGATVSGALPGVYAPISGSSWSSPLSDIVLKLPAGVPSEGTLQLKFQAGASADVVRDLFIRSIKIDGLFCDVDGDGKPNSKDLDSDDDGCPDQIEGNPDAYDPDTITGCKSEDFDGDGIFDRIDKDDDNDGILDETECPPTNYDFSTEGKSAWQIVSDSLVKNLFNGASGKGITFLYDRKVTNNENKLVDSRKNTTLTRQLTNISSGTILTLKDVAWINTAKKEKYNLNQEFTFTLSYAGKDYLTIGTTGDSTANENLKVTAQNGAKVKGSLPTVTSEGWSTAVNLEISLPDGVPSTGNLVLKYERGDNEYYVRDLQIGGMKISGDCDTDGDGIPNRLDTDSDNDGCPDALENSKANASNVYTNGGEKLSYDNLNPDGTLKVSDFQLDTDKNSATYGSLKSKTSSTDSTVTAINADIGTSQDANNQSEYCTKPCWGPDSDGDGVPDSCDEDDDNDGILDRVENTDGECKINLVAADADPNGFLELVPDMFRVVGGTYNGQVVSDAVTANGGKLDNVDLTLIDATAISSPFGNFNDTNVELQVKNASIKVVNGALQFYPGTDVRKAGTIFDFSDSKILPFVVASYNGTTIPDEKATYARGGVVLMDKSAIQKKDGSTGIVAKTNGEKYHYVDGKGVASWRNDFGVPVSGVRFIATNPEAYFTLKVLPECDLDMDGYPNRLDLDSDGDECSDAAEGGNNIPTGGTSPDEIQAGYSFATLPNTLGRIDVKQNKAIATNSDIDGKPLKKDGTGFTQEKGSAYIGHKFSITGLTSVVDCDSEDITIKIVAEGEQVLRYTQDANTTRGRSANYSDGNLATDYEAVWYADDAPIDSPNFTFYKGKERTTIRQTKDVVTYKLKYIRTKGLQGLGCEKLEKSIIVKLKKSSTITGDNEVCKGDRTQLTIADGSLKTGTWIVVPRSTDYPGAAEVDNNGLVTGGSTPGKVQIKFTNSDGCESFKDITVKAISAEPIARDVPYCQGDTPRVLTATGTNLKWYESETGGVASTSAPTPSTATAGTTKYYVTQTENGKCESPRKAITVTVNEKPAVPTIQKTAATCSSASVLRVTNYDGGATYESTPDGLTVGDDGVISGATTETSYTLTARKNGCTSAASTSVTYEDQLSSPNATAYSVSVSPANVCEGAPAETFTITGESGATVTYKIGSGAEQTVTLSGTTATVDAPTTPGTHTITLTKASNGSKCETQLSSDKNASVTVNAKPAAPSVTTEPQSFCQSSKPTVANLEATATGGGNRKMV